MKLSNVCFIAAFVILTHSCLFAQANADAFKKDAQTQMARGKYGEAIDLLNKFISAKPSVVDGYNLRGLCYEKRNQLEIAVYDLRSARKLAPNNADVQKNLERVTKVWYAQLHDKINGHKREIAINPNIPINYLEIGKCHKNLGEWGIAEEWYDDYIKREDPSSDEVIRYTEILARNNHIEKGEKILKKYVEKYPNDHRLWSRYGYFTMWLGKKKIAIDAFKQALKLRPYFKEAQDGLEQAEDRPYIYTHYDTTARTKDQKEKAPEEYIIDKYTRIVTQNPKDNDTRFLLVDQLVKANRNEEAFQHLQVLSNEFTGDPKYTVLWDTVSARRDRVFAINEQVFKDRITKNPSDREAAINLAQIYGRQMNYDGALEVMKTYLSDKTEADDHEMRFMYAKFAAWNYQFETSIEQLNILLAKQPDNLEYQLFRAQVAVWTTTDKEIAHQYLDNVLKSNPKNLEAIVSKATLYIRERNFDDAKAKIDQGNAISPGSKEIETVQNFFDVTMALEEDRKNFEILVAARETAVTGDCPAAIIKYDEYFSKIKAPSKIELLEFADIQSCAKNYGKALEIYDQLLAQEKDYDVEVLKAKATLWGGDSLNALEQFKTLSKTDTSNFDAKFYMAEAYERLKNYDEAKNIYSSLLVNQDDTNKVVLLNKRIGWIPSGSGEGFLSNFPLFTRLAPNISYYSDNQNLSSMNFGGLLEFGLTTYLSLGVSFNRLILTGTYPEWGAVISNYLTTSKLHVMITPTYNFMFTFGFGKLAYQTMSNRTVSDWGIKYEKPKKYSISLRHENTDAVYIISSMSIIDKKADINIYRSEFYYQISKLVKFDGHFSFLKINCDIDKYLGPMNYANDMNIRFGKKYDDEITGGYEFLYTNYAHNPKVKLENPTRYLTLYYSPKNFQAHCIWGEYEYQMEDNVLITGGGKVGYSPADNFFIGELTAKIEYKIGSTFVASGRISLGNSFRDSFVSYDGNQNYQYISAFLSAYWSIF